MLVIAFFLSDKEVFIVKSRYILQFDDFPEITNAGNEGPSEKFWKGRQLG